MSKNRETHFVMRWEKRWQAKDGKGRVEVYAGPGGFSLFDAWFGSEFLGQSHKLKDAKRMVMDRLGTGK